LERKIGTDGGGGDIVNIGTRYLNYESRRNKRKIFVLSLLG
jgi:hypothetical protein